MLSRGYEALDLMILANEDHVPPFIYEYIFFKGRIEMDRLIQAVDRVAAIVPETLYCLDARRSRFKKAGFTARDVVTETAQMLDYGFEWDLRHGPQVTIRVGHGSHKDSMIVAVSHVLADGMGVLQYVSLLADAYSGVLSKVSNNRSSAPILAAASFGPQTEAEKRGAETPSMGLPLTGAGQEFFCRRVTLPKPTMDALHDLSRAHSATLNDVFFAACARVACRTLDLPAVALRCPVDIRPVVDPGPLSVANMTGLYRMSVDVEPDDPFSATVTQVRQEMLRQRKRRRYFFDFPTLAKLSRRFPVSALKTILKGSYLVRPVEYTNCGIQPDFAFSGVGVEYSFMTGAYAAYPEFPFSVSSFAGTTTFAITVVGDENRADASEKVLRRIVAEIKEWLAHENGEGRKGLA